MKERKVHYSINGEDSLRTQCIKYFTSDVLITGTKSKVTCKTCLKLLK